MHFYTRSVSSHTLRLLGLLVCIGLMSACTPPKIPGVYRIDVQQGNVVTKEMLDKIQIGMEKRKVRFVLGTPLISDPFNVERWDYLYSLQKGSGDRTQHRLSVYFTENKLSRIEGETEEFIQEFPSVDSPDAVVVVPVREEKNALFEALTPGFLKKDKVERFAKKGEESEEKVGFLSSITPDFLKKDAAKVEPGGSVASAAVKASGDDQSAANAPAQSAATAEELAEDLAKEDAYLRQLFGDFGRPSDVSNEVTSTSTNESGVQVVDDGLTTGATDQGGFFQRLMKRLKLDEGGTETAPEAATDSVAPIVTQTRD